MPTSVIRPKRTSIAASGTGANSRKTKIASRQHYQLLRDIPFWGVLLGKSRFAEVSDNRGYTFRWKNGHDFLKLGTSERGVTLQQILERELSFVIASEDGQRCDQKRVLPNLSGGVLQSFAGIFDRFFVVTKQIVRR